MISENEIEYIVTFINIDIDYFLDYKNQLKKYCIENKDLISKKNMAKIFIELEDINEHINELMKQKEEFLNHLNTTYYGE
jgi:hypothetical protein